MPGKEFADAKKFAKDTLGAVERIQTAIREGLDYAALRRRATPANCCGLLIHRTLWEASELGFRVILGRLPASGKGKQVVRLTCGPGY